MAVKLGRVNVDAMLRSLTAKQFAEWEAYGSLEPFGELRDDYRAASIREMVHNINVKPEHRKPIEHFTLKYGSSPQTSQTLPPAAPQTQHWKVKKSIARAIVAAYAQKGKNK